MPPPTVNVTLRQGCGPALVIALDDVRLATPQDAVSLIRKGVENQAPVRRVSSAFVKRANVPPPTVNVTLSSELGSVRETA